MTPSAVHRLVPAARTALVDSAFAAGWAGVRGLPEAVTAPSFRAAADVAWKRRGPGVRRLEDNLRRVLGPDAREDTVEAVTRSAVRSYARYWLEVFRLPAMSRDRIVGGMHMADEQRLRDAYVSGRGVILALPHMGNWDHAGAWCALTDMPFTTVAERLRPESVYDRFVRFRTTLGMEVLPLTGGDRPPQAVLAERLRAGGMVCLMADRDIGTGGVAVDFFGARTRMPAGPAVLAVRTGAALLPVTLWYDGGPEWYGRIHPEVRPDVAGSGRSAAAAMTQALADVFAEGISAHPEDWHMLQRLWDDDPVPVLSEGSGP